jgi:enterochelin esterase-like enzyme
MAALYLPPQVTAGTRYPMVYIVGDPAGSLGSGLGLARLGDQLVWEGSTPPFAALVLDASPRVIVRTVVPWAEQRLPFVSSKSPTLVGIGAAGSATLQAALADSGSFRAVAVLASPASAAAEHASAALVRRQAPAIHRNHLRTFVVEPRAQSTAATSRGRQLAQVFHQLALPYESVTVTTTSAAGLASRGLSLALPYSLTSGSTRAAAQAAKGTLPKGWVQILAGPSGGTVWQGKIPNNVVPGVSRDSLVYLPPSLHRMERYPVLYLLHGLRGSPYSFIGGLRFAATADTLIARGRVRPFIAVMPPAGPDISYNGEWTGTWERYVVEDVVPWARANLPIIASAADSGVAGLSAGGYGALDIGLRHPGLFGTLESWSGYYTAPRDGSLTHASAAQLAAHDPTSLIGLEAATLRKNRTRVLISIGRAEKGVQAPARKFAGLLSSLGVSHRLLIVPGQHNGKTWRRQLEGALIYAIGPPLRLPAHG